MPTVGLSMIVRDSAETLSRCLNSARGAVDEMLLADTGSRDSTVQLAQKLGARVISIPWEDDFARARNRALAALHSDWVLVLDADEMLDPDAGQEIRRLIARAPADAFQVTIRNYTQNPEQRIWNMAARPNDSLLPDARGYSAYIDHQNVRLFRRDPEIYFEGCIHETVGWRIRETGRTLGEAKFLIHHFGMADDPAGQERKTLYYRQLSRKKIADMPANAQAHFELGVLELDYFRDNSAALSSFEQACRLNPKLGVAWFFAGVTHLRLAAFDAAIRCFDSAEKLGQASAELRELRGDAEYNSAKYCEARKSYARALAHAKKSPALASKLGLTEVRTGAALEGFRRLTDAIQAAPRDRSLHDRLIAALISTGQLEAAAQAAESKITATDAVPEDFLRAASICAKLKQFSRAASILRRGLDQFSDAPKLQSALKEAESQVFIASASRVAVVPVLQKK